MDWSLNVCSSDRFHSFLVLLAQPILLILGALVITSMLDGGPRLLGRILPIGRGWRLTVIILALFCFLVWTVWLTGSQLSAQASAMQQNIDVHLTKKIGITTGRKRRIKKV